MHDNHTDEPYEVANAVAAPKGRWSLHLVWLVPIVSALIGGWIAIKAVLEHGPTITITFRAAEGLEPGKTKIKYKNVDVGEVRTIAISEDLSHVVVTADMVSNFSAHLVEDTRFWVVRTRVTGGQVTELGTLFSGSYIGLDVGKSLASKRDFEGLEVPPIITGDIAGRQFVLRGTDQGSLDTGTPVYFHRVPVGKVLSTELDTDGAAVMTRIFVAAPHDRYVTTNTRFWNASGVDVTVDAAGLKMRTQSLLSILVGGIAFETPPNVPVAPQAADNTSFVIYPDRDLAMKRPDQGTLRFTVHFTESLRGLAIGAPVELHGLPVGEVVGIEMDYDEKAGTYRFPVELALYPDQLARHVQPDDMKMAHAGAPTRQELDALVARGLRAQLTTGSLLTGQLFVALDFFHDATKASVNWGNVPPELPTTPSSLASLQHTLSHFAQKLDKLPVEELIVDVRRTLGSLQAMLRSTDALAQQLDKQVAPKAEEALQELRRTLLAAERLLATDAPLQQDARDALRQLGRASQSLHELAEFLERHPESLIRGRTEERP
ncbi:MAG: MCE family protein [Nitrospira sp.]|nr:MCE family protein [Nitrospira sp.]